ncbi:hypothetical protein [Ureibacillus xyleni]|nr:hypothetical protein [Ureibacillus xyleni]
MEKKQIIDVKRQISQPKKQIIMNLRQKIYVQIREVVISKNNFCILLLG